MVTTYNLLVRVDGEWHVEEIFVPEAHVADVAEEYRRRGVAEEDIMVEES